MLSKGFIKSTGADTKQRVVASHTSHTRFAMTAQQNPSRPGASVFTKSAPTTEVNVNMMASTVPSSDVISRPG